MLNALLFGLGGQGKSHIAATAPGPLLFADFEGSSYKLPREYVTLSLDELGSVPEVAAGEIDDRIYTVPCSSIMDLTHIINFLHTDQSKFKSFIIDSGTVLTQIAEHELVDSYQGKEVRQAYKALLHDLRPKLTTLKHLLVRTDRALEVLIITAWQRDDKEAPAFSGGIGSFFNHTIDTIGQVKLGIVEGKLTQVMQIWSDKGLPVKAPGKFLIKYGEKITNPNFSTLSQEMDTK